MGEVCLFLSYGQAIEYQHDSLLYNNKKKSCNLDIFTLTRKLCDFYRDFSRAQKF